MYFWLSFVDDRKPEGKQFLGVCIVQAADFIESVRIAHRLGINPGGQVEGAEIPAEFIKTKWVNRLMSKSDCEQFDKEVEQGMN